MKFVSSTSLFVAAVAAYPQARDSDDIYSHWQAAGPDDFRGPCPMLNTLSNHGFLPRDGRNLTETNIVNGLFNGLNFDPALGKIMFANAIPANPEPNATFFTLEMLNVHNVLEHDASLSRSDAYFGNNHIFNQTVFDESASYWTADVMDRDMMANSKLARMLQSKVANPAYRFTSTTEAFSIGEILAPFVAFGDRENVLVDKERVVYFFENEKLPTQFGWTRPENISLTDITRLSAIFAEASSLITTDNTTTTSSQKVRRFDSHFGTLFV